MHTLNPFATASLGALLLLLAGCPSDDEFTQLNQDGDCVRVTIEPVTAGDDDDAADDDDSTADDDDSAADDDDSAGDDDDSAGDDDDSAGDDDDSAGDDDDSAGDDDDATDPANSTNLVPLPGFFGLDVIGTATVDPASGPAGTELTFTIVAILEDTGETSGNPIDAVDRAVVRVNNGSVDGTSNDITLDEWEMTKSAADARRWRLELRAGGDSSTTRRTDELCIVLFSQNE